MKAKIQIYCLFFSLIFTTSVFSLDVPNWSELFQDQKADGLMLPLGKKSGFFIKIPPGFHFGYSQDTAKGSLVEFIPNGETVENWTKMFTVILFPQPVNNFENFVQQFLGSCVPVHSEDLQFRSYGGVKGFCYAWDTYAVKFPECVMLPGMGEFTVKVGFQGSEAFYVLAYATRYSINESNEGRYKIMNGAFDLIESCYEVF